MSNNSEAATGHSDIDAPGGHGPRLQNGEHWRELFEFVDDGFCVIERINGPPGTPLDFRYLEANRAFARETGVSDVVGRTIREAFPDESEEWLRTYDEILTSRRPRHFERDLATIGLVLDLYAFPLGGSGAHRLGVRFTNITAQVRSRERDRQTILEAAALTEALQAARDTADADAQRLNLALDTARLGAWSWDARTDEVALSGRAADIFSMPQESPIRWSSMLDLLHADDRERARDAARSAIALNTDFDIEYRLVNGNRERWVSARARPRYDDSGRILGMFGVVQDITPDRLLVHLDDAVRPLTDPEAITHTAARLLGTHLRVSRCAYATVEDDEDAFVLAGNYTFGTHSIVGRYTFGQFGAACLMLMRANQPYVVTDSQTDPRIDDADRRVYEVTAIRSVVCVPIMKAGRLVAAMAVHDTAPRQWTPAEIALVRQVASRCWESIQRARVERERAQLLEIAEGANRAKDEFLAMLGHELRNPLSPILTALQLMDMNGDQSSRKERTVIERQVRHLTRLVDDLLDVSRIAQGKVNLNIEQIEASDIVGRAIELSSPLLEQRAHRLTMDVPRSGLLVAGDPARLGQIVSNLVSNACKYTPPNGGIYVSAAAEGDDVVLRVRDTGVGIPPDVLPRIFDRFVQGRQDIDRSRGGLGLGLAIVRSLAERHGGSVSAHSDGPGCGSEFVVRLPLAHGGTTSTPSAFVGDRNGRVSVRAVLLVVDDNEDAAALLAQGLRLMGHEVHVAYDGLEALRLAGQRVFDAAFLDLGLPVIDGFELAARLREFPRLNRTRLIAVTGYGQASDRRRTAAAGFHDHLVKPVDLDLVEQLVVSYCSPEHLG